MSLKEFIFATQVESYRHDFTIVINDISSLTELKNSFTRAFPHIKSSHRIEAVARSLGFSTYASLRSYMYKNSNVMCGVSYAIFYEYLVGKGFIPPEYGKFRDAFL